MGLKSSHWSYLKACFKGYTFCFTTFLVRPSTGAQQSHERAPKNFKWPWKIEVLSRRLKFRLCATLKTCDIQILGNPLKCLRGNLGNNFFFFFFLKVLNFVQSFVECKVSLTDGTSRFQDQWFRFYARCGGSDLRRLWCSSRSTQDWKDRIFFSICMKLFFPRALSPWSAERT